MQNLAIYFDFFEWGAKFEFSIYINYPYACETTITPHPDTGNTPAS